jgi:hypothetical protein
LVNLQKQFGLGQNPLPDASGTFAPGGVQLTGLPRRELMPREGLGHRLARIEAGARHWHQKLHRHVSR